MFNSPYGMKQVPLDTEKQIEDFANELAYVMQSERFGRTDDWVKNHPNFEKVMEAVYTLISDCELCGNVVFIEDLYYSKTDQPIGCEECYYDSGEENED